jgi:hypothetical protein
MSLIAELEDMSLRMSPRFMKNITAALDNAMEETTGPSLEHLRASVSDFIGAVKIMGLDELKAKLEELDRILTLPGSMPDNLIRFKNELSELSDSIPSGDREFAKKKDLPSYYMDMEVNADQAVIKSFTAIPGVTEDRARTLYFSGFTTIDGLKSASVAKLFGVPGMPLAVAKKIADHFNPNRLVRIESLIRDEAASPKAELSFVGKTPASRDAESIVTDEVEPGEDTELLSLFLGQLAEYIEVAGAIVQKLSSPGFSSEILLNLEESTQGLVKAARYMGYEHTRSMAERIETTVKDVISGDDRLTRETLIFLNDSIQQLSLGCENLKLAVEKTTDTRAVDTAVTAKDSAVSLEYNILSMAQCLGELQDLFKDAHGLLRKASEHGGFSEEDIARLRKNTGRLDKVAASISEIVESLG